jgi:5-methylthioadenosine/S-adenosylhomocysteine deaminase
MSEQLFVPELLPVPTHSSITFTAGLAVCVEGDTIREVGPADTLKKQHPSAVVRTLPRRALVPGCVNSHNHSFQSLVRGFGDDLPFLEWRARGIYKYSLHLDAEGIYVGALLAFGEMLKNGVTTVCDFFYLNNQRNENARAVIRAAQDLGIRLQLARCFYDWDGAPRVYQETAAEAERNVRELFDAFACDPRISIAIAPHSPHGASSAMIQHATKVSRELGCPLHIHVAEEKFEVEETLAAHGTTPVRYLEKLGVLGPKTVLVHCCWVDQEEVERIGKSGSSLAYNPSSNMFLGDGITPITEMLASGVNIALGTDGGCSNNRVSVFDEMRQVALLQKVRHINGAAIAAESCFPMGNINGGRALGLPVGKIEPGYRADFVVLDLDDLSLQPNKYVLKNVVYAMSAHAIEETIVGGKTVYRNGELTTVPESVIRARVEALTATWT